MPWYDINKHLTCEHQHKRDFSCWSFGENTVVEHYYCPDCKCHWFRGEFYTHKQWDEWIEMGGLDEK